MKVSGLKCPNCGDDLVVDGADQQELTCVFCGNKFKRDGMKKSSKIDDNPDPYQLLPQQKKTRSYHFIWFTSIAGVLILTLAAVFGVHMWNAVITRSRENPLRNLRLETRSALYIEEETQEEAEEEAEERAEPQRERSPMFQTIVENIFVKPVSDVTKEELSQIKYLEINISSSTINYSFDDPYGEEEAEIDSFTTDYERWDVRDIAAFTGLIRLDIRDSSEEIKDLSSLSQLRGIVCEDMDLTELAKVVGDPLKLTELSIEGGESLRGLAAFGNLEILYVEDIENLNLKDLASLGNLKVLTVIDPQDSSSFLTEPEERQTRQAADYSVIAQLPELKELMLESEGIRNAGFVRELGNLQSITLRGTSLLNLDDFRGMEQLIEMTLEENHEVEDFSALGTLVNLKYLTVEKLTDQPDPDLSGLSQLEYLSIDGFMSVASVGKLTGLKDLRILGCNIDDRNALRSLNALESFTLHSSWAYDNALKDLSFIEGMTSLKKADFYNGDTLIGGGLEVYGDISAVFNLAGLEELYIDHGSFEIDFNKVKENPSLKLLSMNNLSLHENYYVESSGGYSNIWYDDVKLDDHTEFLSRFPNLEILNVCGNKLTNLAFAQSLSQLFMLDVEDNYITDLTPLSQKEWLVYLNVIDNPISDTSVVGSDCYIDQ